MARGNHPNAQDPMTPFLSDLVGGDIEVETPNRVHTATSPWAEFAPLPGAGQPTEVRGITPPRMTGNRSGRGKTLTVK
jgi:hypothetical protein